MTRTNLFAATLAVAALALSGTAANAQSAFALTNGGLTLISFDVTNPTAVTSISLTGTGCN